MAEEFLRQLLRAENRIRSDEDHKCIICMEECGIMSPETGLVEFAIRLPVCNHIVGSGCIRKWLQSNNTCPMCRHVFFRESDHHLERDIVEGQRDRVHTNPARTVRSRILTGPLDGLLQFLTVMGGLCDNRCSQLGLPPNVARLARYVLSNLLEPGSSSSDLLEGHDNHCILAVSIDISTYLAGDPRYPREIAAAVEDVEAQQIRDVYNLLMQRRAIDEEAIRYEGYEILNTDTRRFIWPPHGNEMGIRRR
ncbi:hypothetical protein IMSHALPRED_007404 [Imshaugia aleurites]|uniref:RING-type domain-containing protein n=1 Tax=Imshaugia aleurites TaxID=172621 RepID=A0A8H3FUU6_9LECA|nr:hypothetical protein IMSHALPRED_007404 [Imshaugia aleurites]